MNTITITNTALFVAGVAAISTAVELAKTSQFIGAGICAVVGLAAILLYEKLPASNS